MKERVAPIDLGVTWDAGAPEAVLIVPDLGSAVLALNAPFGEPDSSCVVLRWRHPLSATMSAPNDEAISGHRLYRKGLADISWAGRVENSELIDRLERQNRVHDRHNPSRFRSATHYVVLTKERTIEVVADGIEVLRLGGSTLEAAVAALDA